MGVKFDGILKKYIGGFGRFQKIQLLILTFANTLFCMNSIMSVFIAEQPPFHCKVPDEVKELNCTQEEKLIYSVPFVKQHGVEKFSECKIYVRNLSRVMQNH